MGTEWYKCNKSDVGSELRGAFDYLKENSTERMTLQESNAALYDNYLSVNGGGDEISRAIRTVKVPVAYNLGQALVETVVSRLGSTKPGIKLLSTNAKWSLRSEVKKLNDFLVSDWQRQQLHHEIMAILKDSLVYNIGFLKFFNQDNRVQCERVNPLNVLIDDIDGQYGKPRQFIEFRVVPREALKAEFPEKAGAIDDAPRAEGYNYVSSDGRVADLVEVVEGFFLPTKKGNKDGRHVISVGDAVLYDNDKYDNHMGPYVVFRWIEKLQGFWGMGMMEQIRGIQTEINKIALHIQRAVHLGSKPFMLAQIQSGIKPEVIDNNRNRLTLVYYKGGSAKPELVNPSVISPELVRYLDYLWNKGFEVTGVSQAHSTARKPSGLNSGVALREYADITSERFLAAENRLHQLYVDCAHQTIYHAAKIAQNKDYDVSVIHNDVYETIKWKEIGVSEDQYVIRPLPVSSLPKTFAGKIQTISELQQNGLLGPEDAIELLDLPDLERFNSLKQSGRDLVRKTVEKILYEGEFMAPDIMMPLPYAIEYATQVYNLARLKEDAPEENVELLAQFIGSVELLLEQQQMAQQPAEEEAPPQG